MESPQQIRQRVMQDQALSRRAGVEPMSSPDGELYEELVALGVYEHGLSEPEARRWALVEVERYKARWESGITVG